MPVRVRFAPSPTGYLHIGGLRTALYNYVFARRHGGVFVLRIEDTDRERFVEDAESDIRNCLSWAGLEADEGPDAGGPFGPYRQSERTDIYRRHANQLVEAGHAYFAFDTPEDLEAMRAAGSGEGGTYDARTRSSMRNSLTLAPDEVERLLENGTPHVVRLKVDPGVTISFDDAVRGLVQFESETIDDQVLLKSDGYPTYHLANVVDDHLMEISHVIRGEEWLPSTPKHILLYQLFGWTPPQMAHLPLILSPTGGKLSKRSGDRAGIPISVRDYRRQGYEPEALLNFLAFLGWNPGDDRELFTLVELVDTFSLERVGSSGVQFNMEKLGWYNQQYVKRLDNNVLASRVKNDLQARRLHADDAYLARVVGLMKERITRVPELVDAASYFFVDPTIYDPNGVAKRWKSDSGELVAAYADRLESVDEFTEPAIEEVLRALADERGVGAGRIIHPVRLAVSGVTHGPGLFEMLALLGREAVVRRLRKAVEVLG